MIGRSGKRAPTRDFYIASRVRAGESQGVLLEVRHLTVRFAPGGPAAVDDVSFSIGEGETLAVVGEPGGGHEGSVPRAARPLRAG